MSFNIYFWNFVFIIDPQGKYFKELPGEINRYREQ